jgi:hypothetical protein
MNYAVRYAVGSTREAYTREASPRASGHMIPRDLGAVSLLCALGLLLALAILLWGGADIADFTSNLS